MSDTRENTRSRPYYWFQGESVIELAERLRAIGPETARLEVHVMGGHAYLEVIGEGYSGPPINDSRLCPPICAK